MTPYFWQGTRVRLRPMQRGDEGLWLAEELSDSEATRLLGYGIELPKSEAAAAAFVEEHEDFKSKEYFESLEAPAGKRLMIFEKSRHDVLLDEPDRFIRAVRRIATLARGKGDEPS